MISFIGLELVAKRAAPPALPLSPLQACPPVAAAAFYLYLYCTLSGQRYRQGLVSQPIVLLRSKFGGDCGNRYPLIQLICHGHVSFSGVRLTQGRCSAGRT